MFFIIEEAKQTVSAFSKGELSIMILSRFKKNINIKLLNITH